MGIRLDKIYFNHEDKPSTGAITIRRNETQTLPLPEWQYPQHKPTPVAYRLDTVPETIVVKASFYSDNRTRNDLKVQAVACASNDVLGTVSEAMVKFNAGGYSDFVSFQICRHQIKARGVGLSVTHWKWQFFEADGDQWVDFDDSFHQVYSILGKPRPPWDAEFPWTDVLDYACLWATGAQKTSDAAIAITENVYALGNVRVSYIESPTYAHDQFKCTEFLSLLNAGVGTAERINCDDCATIVSTFANILGCELWQSEMGYDFHTNFIRLIGSTKWTTYGFPRHAVAWEGECREQDALYDACLQVDGDGKPEQRDHEPVLPTNIAFGSGEARQNDYKFCLAENAAGDECVPKPENRTRRPLGKGFLGALKFTDPKYLTFLKKRYDFDSWGNVEIIDKTTSALSADTLLQRSTFTGWRILPPEQFVAEDLAAVTSLLLIRPDGHSAMVEINLYESRRAAEAGSFLLQLLGHFHRGDLVRLQEDVVGDVTFVEPEETAIVFKNGKFSGVVRSVGRQAVSTLEIAKEVNDYFKKLYEPVALA